MTGSLKETVLVTEAGSGFNRNAEALLADAIFASGLQRCDEPSASRIRQGATAAIRAFGYPGCAGRVAQEFGDHPETAVIRMRWARTVVRRANADPAANGKC